MADLHIHTALSPCGSKDLTPPAIIAAARRKGLNLIAICDHNSARNVEAVMRAGGPAGTDAKVSVLAGMEITTAEEAHVLGLFPDLAAALAVGEAVRASLPDCNRSSRMFGEQLLMNAHGEVVGRETKMLSAASAFNLGEAVGLIKKYGGLAIAAHVDRPSFSVISQLGLFPMEAGFDAIEVSAAASADGRAGRYFGLGLPVLRSSDSHSLDEIGQCPLLLEMAEPSLAELMQALKGLGGRRMRHA